MSRRRNLVRAEIGVGQKAGVQGFDVVTEDEGEQFAIAS